MSPRQRTLRASNAAALFTTGLGVGWLIGLSVSPILHVIVGSVIAVVTAVVGALAGIQLDAADTSQVIPKPHRGNVGKIDPLPLTMLVLGIVIASSFGVYARTNEWLGVAPEGFAHRWRGIGLNNHELKKRLFDYLYSKSSGVAGARTKGEGSTMTSLSAGLFAVTATDCQGLRLKHGSELRAAMQALSDPAVDAALAKCKDDQCLEAIKMLICAKAE
jgi:hypothetical protein